MILHSYVTTSNYLLKYKLNFLIQMKLYFNFIMFSHLTQDDHSGGQNGRLKRPETAEKRCNKALIFTLFRRIPSTRFEDRFFPLESGHCF